MAKVHITLVGSQPIPVYKGIVNDRPDKVVLVCSKGTEKVAKRVKDLAEKRVEPSPAFVQVKVSPANPKKIRRDIVEKISAEVSDGDEVTANITGGTKLWSIFLYDFFKGSGQTLCYYIGQNDKVYSLYDNTDRGACTPLDIEETFQLHDIKIARSSLYDMYTEADFNALATIHEMRDYNSDQLSELIRLFSNKNNPHPNTAYSKKDEAYIEYKKNARKEERSITCQLTRKGDTNLWVIKSPNVLRLIKNNGWFELDVAQQLHQCWPEAQMLLNCGLKFKSDVTLNEKKRNRHHHDGERQATLCRMQDPSV